MTTAREFHAEGLRDHRSVRCEDTPGRELWTFTAPTQE